jgi:[CysO sulfur-carrier protein]-S-L-cysteine hydrolase
LKLINKEIDLRIVIDDVLLARLNENALKHYPKEFGGLLIGYYAEDRKTVFISETILPKKYTSTKYSFTRGSEGLRELLEDYHASEPSLIYVGEWHTHPDNPAIPSTTDLAALKEIVAHDEVYINHPILLILSITKQTCVPAFYVHYQNKIYSYDKEKDLYKEGRP